MLLSRIEFGTLLSYTPYPETEEQRESKTWMTELKRDGIVLQPRVTFTQLVAQRIREKYSELPFAGLLHAGVTLVPVPSSACKKSGALHVPMNLARALEREGLGKVLDCLHRIRPVTKAATATPQERPRAAEHFATMAIECLLEESAEILLVDDVITRGATLLGAASRLLAHFPGIQVRAFAAMRTINRPQDFQGLWDPRRGAVFLDERGETFRRP